VATTAASEVHGFPAALTSFIGREEAVHDVAGLLEECRLVTVTGPGGSGKTRLADQVARQVAGRFADGAWLAGLAAVRDPAQVAAVVAAALGIREQPGVPAAETLARVLELALADQTWYAALPALGQMEPSAVSAIYQTLIEAV
jgi:ATP/maltotriose-dependent transcriptional regulator MalT